MSTQALEELVILLPREGSLEERVELVFQWCNQTANVNGLEATEKVAALTLLREIDRDQSVTEYTSKVLNARGLANTCFTN